MQRTNKHGESFKGNRELWADQMWARFGADWPRRWARHVQLGGAKWFDPRSDQLLTKRIAQQRQIRHALNLHAKQAHANIDLRPRLRKT